MRKQKDIKGSRYILVLLELKYKNGRTTDYCNSHKYIILKRPLRLLHCDRVTAHPLNRYLLFSKDTAQLSSTGFQACLNPQDPGRS